MGITEASIFLTSTLLVSLGIIVIVAGALIVNNMIHRWWKPFTWSVVPGAWKQVASSDFNDLETAAKPNQKKDPILDEVKK
jgi:hypothetical protein